MYSVSSRIVDMTCNNTGHAFRLMDEHGRTMKEIKSNWSTLYTVLIRVPHRGGKVTPEGQQIQLVDTFESHGPK